MNFVIYSLIYIQDKFGLYNFKSLKFTATFSWSPPSPPLKSCPCFTRLLCKNHENENRCR
jgi:hypothetical protein